MTTELPLLRERNWTEAELVEAGFRYHLPHKKVVMSRELPPEEAPLVIKTDWDTLIAVAGYMICFESGATIRQKLYDYPHWPVEPGHFAALYRAWEGADWFPTPTEDHLLSLGCAPYYKAVGVWAKKLDQPLLVQSLESLEPVLVPGGTWLCIAAAGAAWGHPYSTTDAAFLARYQLVS